MSTPDHTNRLINEKSPYLQQHARNPVDWYPWGEEAFKDSKNMDRPILLSIGYATCHWCHVMERESFNDPGVAELLNNTFVCVKVDREEMPEVDNLYMEFAQAMMGGAAGWPLNVVLTPELEPFFATTYMPVSGHSGLMGIRDLVHRIREIWLGSERESMVLQAKSIVAAFAEPMSVNTDLPNQERLGILAHTIYASADPVYGGLAGAPKFPLGYQSEFFLNYARENQDSRAMFYVERSLTMMHRGGIYDHIGGGFARYSMDECWRIPHFEKMLYDNALQTQAYLAMWRATAKPLYRQIVEETLNYLLRDMQHPGGGFYSAEDADSEGKEGAFYTWTYQELVETLGLDEATIFCALFGVSEEGNFQRKNVLYIAEDPNSFSQEFGLDMKQMADLIKDWKTKLFEKRETRTRPFRDEKILTSWNGLLIHTLIQAACVLGSKDYAQAAVQTAEFIEQNLWKEGVLLRRWCDGEGRYPGGLDDYAFLIRALLSLFEAGKGSRWLAWAIELTEIVEERFKSDEGAYYLSVDNEHLLVRRCQFSDGAEPSGNAVHCENLQRLFSLTHDHKYLKSAEDILKAVKPHIEGYPLGYCYHHLALQRYLSGNQVDIVVVLNKEDEYLEVLKQMIHHKHLPYGSVTWLHHDDQLLRNLLPHLNHLQEKDGKTTLYLCRKGTCQEPVTELAGMIDAINTL